MIHPSPARAPREARTAVFNDEPAVVGDLLVDHGLSPEQIVIAGEDQDRRNALIGFALLRLNDGEFRVITARYLDYDRVSLSELGIEFGVARERVRQIEVAALAKMRLAFEACGVTGLD